MALIKRRRLWSTRVYLFGKQVWISTGTTLKSEAENMERQILVACGSRVYGESRSDDEKGFAEDIP